MSCLAREIIVTELSILSTFASPCKGQRDAIPSASATSGCTSSGISICTTALFWSQVEGGYISIPFVEKAFGSRVPRGRSGMRATARVTWHFAILDQGPETSHLRVVSELGHDVVFGRGAGCNAPVNQQLLCRNASQEGWLRLFTVVEDLARLDDSKLCKKLADGSFIKLFASGCGFELQGELSVKAFASLLRQRIEATRHSHQPAGNNLPPRARAATPDVVSLSEEADSPASSGFDEGDLAYEGSTTSDEMTFERSFHQTPPFLHGTNQAFTENISNTSIQTAQLIRGSSPSSSISSWSLIENPSPRATIEDNAPMKAGRAETEENEDEVSAQDQMSNLDMHPGHKAWVWDKDRQRWRRRGRSGQEETDWFPESFA